MINNNSLLYSGKIIIKIFYSFIYFPIWWYGRGFIKILASIKESIILKQKRLGFFIWIKNIFTPMFGQYDWQGKLISFSMRLAQIVFRGFILLIWIMFLFLFLLIWITLPILVIYNIFYQLL